MIGLGLCFALIHFSYLFLAVMVEYFLFGCLILVIGDPNILICLPLLCEVMELGISSFLICSSADGNGLDMSLKGYMGSCNLCKLSHS
jgi:hypothetical protein